MVMNRAMSLTLSQGSVYCSYTRLAMHAYCMFFDARVPSRCTITRVSVVLPLFIMEVLNA